MPKPIETGRVAAVNLACHAATAGGGSEIVSVDRGEPLPPVFPAELVRLDFLAGIAPAGWTQADVEREVAMKRESYENAHRDLPQGFW